LQVDNAGAVAFHTGARNCLSRAVEFLSVRKCRVPLCLNLLSLEGDKVTTCVRCEQLDDLFGMVAGLKEDVVEGPPRRLSRARRLTPHPKTASDKKTITVGNSLLRGTDSPIYWPDLTHGEVYCLPG